MNHLLLVVPESFSLDTLSDDARDLFEDAGVIIPYDICPGTQVFNGNKLVIAVCKLDPEEFLEMADQGYTKNEGRENARGVSAVPGFSIQGRNKGLTNPNSLRQYMLPDREYDDEGNITRERPVTDITGKLPYFAGRKWQY